MLCSFPLPSSFRRATMFLSLCSCSSASVLSGEINAVFKLEDSYKNGKPALPQNLICYDRKIELPTEKRTRSSCLQNPRFLFNISTITPQSTPHKAMGPSSLRGQPKFTPHYPSHQSFQLSFIKNQGKIQNNHHL